MSISFNSTDALRMSRNVPCADTDVLEVCHHNLGDRGHGRGRPCFQDLFIQQRLLRPGTPRGGRAVASRTLALPGVLTVGQEPRSGPGLWVSKMRWGLDGCLESMLSSRPCLRGSQGLSGLGAVLVPWTASAHLSLLCPSRSFEGIIKIQHTHRKMCPF